MCRGRGAVVFCPGGRLVFQRSWGGSESEEPAERNLASVSCHRWLLSESARISLCGIDPSSRRGISTNTALGRAGVASMACDSTRARACGTCRAAAASSGPRASTSATAATRTRSRRRPRGSRAWTAPRARRGSPRASGARPSATATRVAAERAPDTSRRASSGREGPDVLHLHAGPPLEDEGRPRAWLFLPRDCGLRARLLPGGAGEDFGRGGRGEQFERQGDD